MAASRGFRLIACWLIGLAVSFCLLMPLPAGRADDYEVDLALVLAIDCSFSVDSREFAVQMRGLGQAFQTEAVKRAIAQGVRQRIAVTAVQWSDDRNQKVVVPWTVVSGGADADELGQIFMHTQRQLTEGGTSLSMALTFSSALFAAAPAAERRVIDVSTDGRNNSGPPVAPVRDRVVAQGITINGLTILNEWPTLDTYFEANVAGGTGHFVIPANDYDAYAQAILRKLLREITGPGIT
ncbi:hypothetical protein DK847_05265 [Aestuariivirga litoralis]|uniref:VWFA domain-containing protein n=1 Tax=Aestuariivirga litoralis TaxID=2650924 RepID=A0A2W2BQ39_9HYPH|nr:DUF1194 domain-containing protein [Aestuariivirga litoralis]PZF77837.1 hypothetical protein DK847_05265 [Aestuariivirga litoralis]